MGSATRACDHTYPAWYDARRTCCSNAALIGGVFSIVRQPCANTYFLASFTPLAEHVLQYMPTMNLPIFSGVSELISTGCRDRSREESATGGQ